MTGSEPPTSSLIGDLRAALVGMEQARRMLDRDQVLDAEHIWSRLEACARRIAALNSDERKSVEPVMLAVLDELNGTIADFSAERDRLKSKLHSTKLSLTAEAAYKNASGR